MSAKDPILSISSRVQDVMEPKIEEINKKIFELNNNLNAKFSEVLKILVGLETVVNSLRCQVETLQAGPATAPKRAIQRAPAAAHTASATSENIDPQRVHNALLYMKYKWLNDPEFKEALIQSFNGNPTKLGAYEHIINRPEIIKKKGLARPKAEALAIWHEILNEADRRLMAVEFKQWKEDRRSIPQEVSEAEEISIDLPEEE